MYMAHSTSAAGGQELQEAWQAMQAQAWFSVTVGAEQRWSQVIYGDTDSIMVATGAQDLQEAAQLAGRIKREVNKRYRLLEIEEDGLFKRMLLLKKKKYAALKLVREPDGSWSQVCHGSDGGHVPHTHPAGSIRQPQAPCRCTGHLGKISALGIELHAGV